MAFYKRHEAVKFKKLLFSHSPANARSSRSWSLLFDLCCRCPLRVSPQLQEPLLAEEDQYQTMELSSRLASLETRVNTLEKQTSAYPELTHAIQRKAGEIHARLDLHEAKLDAMASMNTESGCEDFLSAFGEQLTRQLLAAER